MWPLTGIAEEIAGEALPDETFRRALRELVWGSFAETLGSVAQERHW